MFGVVLFIIAILGSILLHEAGHFVTARMSGMKVHEFFVGFGPRIWSFKRGETEYGVKALPFGGYVKIAGMNPYEEVDEADKDRVYKSKPAWKRLIVLAAGSTMHFVIAFVLLFGIFAFIGVNGKPTLIVSEVAPGTPAATVGVQSGDEIRQLDGTPVTDWDAFVEDVRAIPGESVDLTVLRDGETLVLSPTVGTRPDDATQGFLGIGPEVVAEKESIPGAIAQAGKEVTLGAWASVKGFVGLFNPESIGRLLSVATGSEERTERDPASLVGIGQQTTNFVNDGNWLGFFSLVAAFNIFIGVANLMPLPPLDGGHIAVLAYEKIRKREVDMVKLMPITMTVILAFGMLFMLLLYLDIAKPLPTF